MNNLEKIAIDKLSLDIQNPRTNNGKIKTEEDVIKELIEEDIDSLINNIAKFGFLAQSVLTVVKVERDFVVVDGNRRLLSLKILKKLDLFKNYLSKTKFDKYKKLSNDFTLNNINCVVHDNRKDADREMAILHLSGEQIRRWKLIRQYRYFYEKVFTDNYELNDLSEMLGIKESFIRKGIVLYVLFLYTQKYFSAQYDITDNNFKMDKFSKLVFATDRRRFLGYDFDWNNSKLVFLVDEKEFKLRLKYVLDKVFDSDVSAQIKKKEIDGILKIYDPTWLNDREYKKAKKKEREKNNNGNQTLFNNIDKSDRQKNTEKNNSLYENNIERLVPTLIKKNKKAPAVKLKKIKNIYKELQNITVSICPTATFALVRILVDISVYNFLKLKGHEFNEYKHLIVHDGKNKSSLKEKMNFIVTEYLNNGDELRKLVATLNEDYLTKNLNEVMHNTIFSATGSKIKDYWENLLPFLEFLWEEIKKMESNKK